jgi:hypothetical protein
LTNLAICIGRGHELRCHRGLGEVNMF